jgi:small GTP-binding protein
MSTKSLSCKVVLLGEGSVGKTSLRRTYLGEGFRESYSMTIGADFAANRISIDGWEITTNIWDLAGQHRFKKLRETYYRGVSGALLVYDITRPETLTALPQWIDELQRNNNGRLVPMTLIANKEDLREEVESSVSNDEGIAYAQELSATYGDNISFVGSSAKTGENVPQAFETLIKLIFNRFLESHKSS